MQARPLQVQRSFVVPALTASDEPDLRQELSMHVIAGLRRHDPGRASIPTFADRIVASKVVSIVKHATAAKRDRRNVRSIDSLDDRIESDRATAGERHDVALDVREALAALPDELSHLASLLMEHREAEVVRRTGLTRQTVRGRCKRIAQHLRGRGLPDENSLRHNQPGRGVGIYA